MPALILYSSSERMLSGLGGVAAVRGFASLVLGPVDPYCTWDMPRILGL